jgi:hypothetical protein
VFVIIAYLFYFVGQSPWIDVQRCAVANGSARLTKWNKSLEEEHCFRAAFLANFFWLLKKR